MAQDIHYLYVCASGVTALRYSRQGLQVSTAFAPEFESDSNGNGSHVALGQWLTQHQRDIFSVIVDVVEEEFSIEQMPKLGRMDQSAMIKRRIKQKFRDARLNQWSAVGSSGKGFRITKAKNEQIRVLMSAIARDQALAPWFNTLEQAKVAVRSVVSPALLTLRMMRQELKAASGLVVSWSPGGLRQTLVIDGEVRFSRLAGNLKAIDASGLQMECLRTVQYLLMSQQISRDALRGGSLPVWVLEGAIAHLEQLPAQLAVDSTVEMPLQVVAASVLATEHAPSLGALPTWCAIEMLRPVPGAHQRGYADAGLRHDFSVRATKSWLMKSGVAALSGASVCLAASIALQFFWPAESATSRMNKQRVLNDQGALQADLGRYAVAGPAMRRVVEIADALRERHVDPLPLMQISADALEADPTLQMQSMRWRRIETAQVSDWKTLDVMGKSEGGGQGGKTTPPGGLGLGSGPLGGSPGGSPGSTPGGSFGQVPLGSTPVGGALGSTPGQGGSGAGPSPVLVELIGAISGEPAMQRANEQVKGLTARLQQMCECEVHISKLPFDPEPGSGFNKTFTKAEDKEKKGPEFTVRWLLKEPSSPSTVVQTPGSKATADRKG